MDVLLPSDEVMKKMAEEYARMLDDGRPRAQALECAPLPSSRERSGCCSLGFPAFLRFTLPSLWGIISDMEMQLLTPTEIWEGFNPVKENTETSIVSSRENDNIVTSELFSRPKNAGRKSPRFRAHKLRHEMARPPSRHFDSPFAGFLPSLRRHLRFSRQRGLCGLYMRLLRQFRRRRRKHAHGLSRRIRLCAGAEMFRGALHSHHHGQRLGVVPMGKSCPPRHNNDFGNALRRRGTHRRYGRRQRRADCMAGRGNGRQSPCRNPH